MCNILEYFRWDEKVLKYSRWDEKELSFWQYPAHLGKPGTYSTCSLLAMGEIMCQEVKLLLLPYSMDPISDCFPLFAPVVCWNISAGLSEFHKGTLIHGWLSKLVCWGVRGQKTYSAMLTVSLSLYKLYNFTFYIQGCNPFQVYLCWQEVEDKTHFFSYVDLQFMSHHVWKRPSTLHRTTL